MSVGVGKTLKKKRLEVVSISGDRSPKLDFFIQNSVFSLKRFFCCTHDDDSNGRRSGLPSNIPNVLLLSPLILTTSGSFIQRW